MKKVVLTLTAIIMASAVKSQDGQVFRHLDASVDMGTTGVGIELSSPMGNYLQLRGGFSVMPKFHHNMTFGVQVGETNDETRFNKLSTMMENFTGHKINNTVDMIGEPTWSNAHLLVDVFPFKNKHWHFTAGVYVGPSKVAKAYNTTEDMASLLGVSSYNMMYDRAMAYEPVFKFNSYQIDDPEFLDILHDSFLVYGRMGVHIGEYKQDVYYTIPKDMYLDVDGDGIPEFHEAGERVLRKAGDPYMMEPDEEDGMVKVSVKTNAVRPYLGFGYTGRLVKGDDRYKISFDCGAMFWGGTPRIYTHDGTDLSRDVENIGGKVGTYVDLIKAFKVFPVLNVRITRTIF